MQFLATVLLLNSAAADVLRLHMHMYIAYMKGLGLVGYQIIAPRGTISPLPSHLDNCSMHVYYLMVKMFAFLPHGIPAQHKCK